MFRVTGAAILAATSRFHDSRMVSATCANASCNLCVAIQALEGSFTDAEFVTRRTVRGTGEPGMSTRERTRGDLCRRKADRANNRQRA